MYVLTHATSTEYSCQHFFTTVLLRQILGALPAGKDNFLYNVPRLSVLNISTDVNTDIKLTFSLLRTLVSGG